MFHSQSVMDQINVCGRWLQEEELAVTFALKQYARFQYQKELRRLKKMKKQYA